MEQEMVLYRFMGIGWMRILFLSDECESHFGEL